MDTSREPRYSRKRRNDASRLLQVSGELPRSAFSQTIQRSIHSRSRCERSSVLGFTPCSCRNTKNIAIASPYAFRV